MSNEPDDTDLRRHFAALRQADARKVSPGFGPVWTRVTASLGRRRTFQPRKILTGALVVGAAVLIMFVHRRSARPAVTDIASWRSPTAFLLRGPGDALLSDTRIFASSAIPIIAIPDLSGGTP